jgi:hypothetical protein
MIMRQGGQLSSRDIHDLDYAQGGFFSSRGNGLRLGTFGLWRRRQHFLFGAGHGFGNVG